MIKDSRINPTGLCVLSLYVPTKHRRKGVGSRLLDHADTVAADRGINTLTLDVAADNTGALELYNRHGYVVTDYNDVCTMTKAG